MSFSNKDLWSTVTGAIITKAGLAQDRYGVRGVLDFLQKKLQVESERSKVVVFDARRAAILIEYFLS
jgi:hypothetical protein